MTADNSFTLYINGKPAGNGSNFNSLTVIDARGLHPGANVLAVAAENSGDTDNPAGLIGVLRVEFEHGEPLVVATDGKWTASKQKSQTWLKQSFQEPGWVAAKELGGWKMAHLEWAVVPHRRRTPPARADAAGANSRSKRGSAGRPLTSRAWGFANCTSTARRSATMSSRRG